MRLAYICSPLRGNDAHGKSIEQNIRKADEYCAYAASCGVIPLAPHTIFTKYLDDEKPEQREQGLKMGLELLKHCDEIWVMGSMVSTGMYGEIELAEKLDIPRLYVSDEHVQAGYQIRQNDAAFSYKDCIPESEKMDYENQILVLKPEAYGQGAKITADDSLWLARTGFGCTHGARGQAVYAENLLSVRYVRWERSDFYGIVDPLRLFSWINDKPVMNQRAEEILQSMESTLTERENAEEIEAEL